MEGYLKHSLIGRGDFSEVYHVTRTDDQSYFVMKCMEGLGAELAAAIVNDNRRLLTLDHPNIIRHHDIFVHNNDTVCIVMQRVDGGDLQKRISSRRGIPFSEREIYYICKQLVAALQWIHGHHMVHGNLKAENVFFNHLGNVKVGSFGLRTNANVGVWDVTSSDPDAQTHWYTPPEVVNTRSPLTIKSDIWSLGVILYELATLQLPFFAESPQQLAVSIGLGTYEPIKGHYSPTLGALVDQMLQADPKKRPLAEDIWKSPWFLMFETVVPFVPIQPNAPFKVVRLSRGIYEVDILPTREDCDERIRQLGHLDGYVVLDKDHNTVYTHCLWLFTSKLVEHGKATIQQRPLLGPYTVVRMCRGVVTSSGFDTEELANAYAHNLSLLDGYIIVNESVIASVCRCNQKDIAAMIDFFKYRYRDEDFLKKKALQVDDAQRMHHRQLMAALRLTQTQIFQSQVVDS